MALRTARNKSFELGSFSVLRGLDRAYWGPVNRFSEFVAGSRSKIEKIDFLKKSWASTYKARKVDFEGSSLVPSEKAIGLKIDMRPS